MSPFSAAEERLPGPGRSAAEVWSPVATQAKLLTTAERSAADQVGSHQSYPAPEGQRGKKRYFRAAEAHPACRPPSAPDPGVLRLAGGTEAPSPIDSCLLIAVPAQRGRSRAPAHGETPDAPSRRKYADLAPPLAARRKAIKYAPQGYALPRRHGGNNADRRLETPQKEPLQTYCLSRTPEVIIQAEPTRDK